jgi:hypothetical protein
MSSNESPNDSGIGPQGRGKKGQMLNIVRLLSWGALTGGAILLGAAGWQTSALAASDYTTDTYAADGEALALPEGTILAFEYAGFRHADEYIQNSNNVFGKLEGLPRNIPAGVGAFTDILRVAYFSRLWDHPLVFEAAATFVSVTEADLAGAPVTVNDGVRDAVLFLNYGAISEPKNERYLALSNYSFIPAGNYDKFKVLNTSTPNQYTDIPEIIYAEGLSKFGAQNFWFDFIGTIAIHSDGDSPFAAAPGVQFNKLTQDNSYDVKAYLRYVFAQSFWIAAGIEKSWGGNQIASGGALGATFGPTSFGEDNYLKGHLQGSIPITSDFHVAVDLTHDFEREGGQREDFTTEIRLVKVFLPETTKSLK